MSENGPLPELGEGYKWQNDQEQWSTERDAEEYREDLFPECKDQAALLEYLRNKTIGDIGSGLTHTNPYSLANIAARQAEYNIKFFPIEPRTGFADSKKGFRFQDRYIARPVWRIRQHVRRMLADTPESRKRYKDTPAKPDVISASAEVLPFEKETVDIFLSDFSLFFGIREKKTAGNFRRIVQCPQTSR